MSGSFSSAPPVIGCAYPLNDDGSVAASLGLGYAGPAVGEDQQSMDYTTTGVGGLYILLSMSPFGAIYELPVGNDAAFEAIVPNVPIASGGNGAAIFIHTAGSAVNTGLVFATADNDLISFIVTPGGVISAELNGAPTAMVWGAPSPTTIAPGQKYGAALFTFDAVASELSTATLRTYSADMTGTYTAGTTDPCGNVI